MNNKRKHQQHNYNKNNNNNNNNRSNNDNKRFCSTPNNSGYQKSPCDITRNPMDIPIENKKSARFSSRGIQNNDSRPNSRPSTPTLNDMTPRGINVLQYAESRALEIKNLKTVLQDSKDLRNGLAFQQLPRHMRRRAASHDIRRIPKRLRAKAESQATSTTIKPPSRKYKRRPKNLLEEYTRRSRKQCWLETHIWHAKRFKMVSKWGYKLAEEPCDKSFRATYRATQKTSLLQDKSYMEFVEIIGRSDDIIQKMIDMLPFHAHGKLGEVQYSNGDHHGTLLLYHPGSSPWKPIGPVTFLWETRVENKLILICHPGVSKELLDVLKQVFEVNEIEEVVSDGGENREEREEQEEEERPMLTETDEIANQPASDTKDTSKLEVDQLKVEEESRLKETDDEFATANSSSDSFRIRHHKLNFVYFSLTGPESFSILQRVFTLPTVASLTKHGVNEDNDNDLWQQQQCEKQLVEMEKSVFNLYVNDPRFHLPEKKQNPTTKESKVPSVSSVPMSTVSSTSSLLWQDRFRQLSSKRKLADHDINKMRSEQLVPGSDLSVESSVIPVVVLQRSTSKPRKDKKTQLSYDVILPKHWAMPLLISLVYQGVRVGGLREDRNINFELLSPHFPTNYPDTKLGQETENEDAVKREEHYKRRPPAKRLNYDVLGINSPFTSPWLYLVKEWNFNCATLLPSFHNTNDITTKSCKKDSFYVLRDVNTLSLIQKFMSQQFQNSDEKTESLKQLTSALQQHCFSMLAIKMVSSQRGCPDSNAQLHIPKHDDFTELKRNEDPLEHKFYGPIEPLHKGLKNNFPFVFKEHDILRHNVRHIGTNTRWLLGYVQSGRYSFSEGGGTGLGFISLVGLMYLFQENKEINKLLYRNIDEFQFRFCDFELLIT